MDIASPTNVASAQIGATYEVAVARKVLDAVQEQGQQAVQLIQAAGGVPDHVGSQLNIVA
jgi:hypothetical protein